jgi:hypothetical protein
MTAQAWAMAVKTVSFSDMAHARSLALNPMRNSGITNVAQALWSGALTLDPILV